jgi:4-alpha-glucanotransferase
MKHWKKNRTLLSAGKDAFFQSWHFHRTRAYHTLSEEEKTSLHGLIEKKGSLSEKIWEQNGKKLLSVLKDASDMRVCAEDLGVVPDCVPRVLSKLELYSLKIGFWNREYRKPGQPFVRIENYPRLSVATLSVHDSQVFRQWWDNEADMDTKRGFCSALGVEEFCRKPYTPAAAEKLLEGFFMTSAEMCILQIQEFFALDTDLRRDPVQERINVPGTVSELNWTYRIPVPLEKLLDRERLCSIIQKLTTKRRSESGGA